MSRQQLASEMRTWKGLRDEWRAQGQTTMANHAATALGILHEIARVYYQPRRFYGG